MKTISLQTACDLLDKAIFLSLSSAGCDVTYNSWGLPDKDEEEFLTVQWEDEGQGFKVAFHAKDNQTVVIDGNVMVLIAEDGGKEGVSLVFEFADLEKMLK